ncbi:hypothetical protein D9611_006291 [Ephemerocybe angulata]|uniref:Peptidase A1 domain-containing protein n=1 Tax=Ephemerocybe angulata TaxID=980116 RepID=A0A8H5FG94_9AGAR|nr:hypothetical protein D9611_006291 [Tulosesus angulatus]
MRSTIAYVLPCAVLLALSILAEGRTFQFQATRELTSIQRRAPIDAKGPKIDNIKGIRYTTSVTVNGKDVVVLLDTGSTDLWVAPPGGIGKFNDSAIPLDLKYGDGSYGVSGTIGVAPFEMGDFKIEQQAFLNAKENTIAATTELGIHGVLGLAFQHGTASPINLAIKSKYGMDATWGRSVLHNIFEKNPDEPNFIAIDLARSDDMEDVVGGSFGIGEYDEKWAAVVNAPPLPLFPRGADRWTVLLEGIKVNGETIKLKPSTAKPPAPAGSLVALLDTGAPPITVPSYITDAIYSKIPGARLYKGPDASRWFVPCNGTASVSFTLGGQDFPLNPVDLTDVETMDDGTTSACMASITSTDEKGLPFEALLGTPFLRNVYTVYDFGDKQPDGTNGDPYIKLYPQTDAAKAAAQAPIIRAKTMQGYPPEIDAEKLNAEIDAAMGGTTTDPTSVTGEKDGESLLEAAGSSGGGSLGPAMIGLLAANLIVTIIVAVFGILNCRRHKGEASSSRSGGGTFSTVSSWAPTLGKPYASVPASDVEEGKISSWTRQPKPYASGPKEGEEGDKLLYGQPTAYAP